MTFLRWAKIKTTLTFCFVICGAALYEPETGPDAKTTWRTVDVTSVTRGKALGEGDDDQEGGEGVEKYEKFDLGQYNFKIVMDVAPKPKRIKKLKQKKKTAVVVKKTKKKKSKKGPRRPKNAFMFFSGDKRAEVTGANPEARVSEIAKILGGMWREMDDDARASYQEDADNDKGKRESGGDCSWRPVP